MPQAFAQQQLLQQQQFYQYHQLAQYHEQRQREEQQQRLRVERERQERERQQRELAQQRQLQMEREQQVLQQQRERYFREQQHREAFARDQQREMLRASFPMFDFATFEREGYLNSLGVAGGGVGPGGPPGLGAGIGGGVGGLGGVGALGGGMGGGVGVSGTLGVLGGVGAIGSGVGGLSGALGGGPLGAGGMGPSGLQDPGRGGGVGLPRAPMDRAFDSLGSAYFGLRQAEPPPLSQSLAAQYSSDVLQDPRSRVQDILPHLAPDEPMPHPLAQSPVTPFSRAAAATPNFPPPIPTLAGPPYGPPTAIKRPIDNVTGAPPFLPVPGAPPRGPSYYQQSPLPPQAPARPAPTHPYSVTFPTSPVGPATVTFPISSMPPPPGAQVPSAVPRASSPTNAAGMAQYLQANRSAYEGMRFPPGVARSQQGPDMPDVAAQQIAAESLRSMGHGSGPVYGDPSAAPGQQELGGMAGQPAIDAVVQADYINAVRGGPQLGDDPLDRNGIARLNRGRTVYRYQLHQRRLPASVDGKHESPQEAALVGMVGGCEGAVMRPPTNPLPGDWEETGVPWSPPPGGLDLHKIVPTKKGGFKVPEVLPGGTTFMNRVAWALLSKNPFVGMDKSGEKLLIKLHDPGLVPGFGMTVASLKKELENHKFRKVAWQDDQDHAYQNPNFVRWRPDIWPTILSKRMVKHQPVVFMPPEPRGSRMDDEMRVRRDAKRMLNEERRRLRDARIANGEPAGPDEDDDPDDMDIPMGGPRLPRASAQDLADAGLLLAERWSNPAYHGAHGQPPEEVDLDQALGPQVDADGEVVVAEGFVDDDDDDGKGADGGKKRKKKSWVDMETATKKRPRQKPAAGKGASAAKKGKKKKSVSDDEDDDDDFMEEGLEIDDEPDEGTRAAAASIAQLAQDSSFLAAAEGAPSAVESPSPPLVPPTAMIPPSATPDLDAAADLNAAAAETVVAAAMELGGVGAADRGAQGMEDDDVGGEEDIDNESMDEESSGQDGAF